MQLYVINCDLLYWAAYFINCCIVWMWHFYFFHIYECVRHGRTRPENQTGNFYSCTVKLEKCVNSSLCLSVCLRVKLC